MTEAVEPFTLAIPEADLADLQARLRSTRWPDKETVEGWDQGVPLDEAKNLIEYWSEKYDWRRCETQLNAMGQFRTVIDGLGFHFLHIRSPHPDAMPLIITHGWPGSVIEFLKVIDPLTDPLSHGGSEEDAFHLVLPSLPGFGFSDKPTSTGWGVSRIAGALVQLMKRLGYDRFVAQGGDWGAAVTTAMGVARPHGLAAIHLNFPIVLPPPPYDDASPAEKAMLAQLAQYERWESGYAKQQSTRPQTLGYGLVDSPAGQALWIYEKLRAWMDCTGNPRNVLTLDEILDNIMLYWLPRTAAPSGRLYWESFRDAFGAVHLDIATGCSIFPSEIYRAPRSWAQRCIKNLIYWGEAEKGGHFAAFEQPEIFVREVRNCFRQVR